MGIFHALMRNVLSFANAHNNHYTAKVRNILYDRTHVKAFVKDVLKIWDVRLIHILLL